MMTFDTLKRIAKTEVASLSICRNNKGNLQILKDPLAHSHSDNPKWGNPLFIRRNGF